MSIVLCSSVIQLIKADWIQLNPITYSENYFCYSTHVYSITVTFMFMKQACSQQWDVTKILLLDIEIIKRYVINQISLFIGLKKCH